MEKEIFPLSTAALTQAQASRRELEKGYRNALVLESDGYVYRIEHIEVLGAWGGSIGRKLLSRLTGAWHIAVHFSEPLSWNFEDLRELIVECVRAHGHLGSPQLEDTSVRQEAVESIIFAKNIEEIFKILQMPTPENALDVL